VRDERTLTVLVAAEFAVHRLPDGSQDIGTQPPHDTLSEYLSALYADELNIGTLE
jgi:hypothetical protein